VRTAFSPPSTPNTLSDPDTSSDFLSLPTSEFFSLLPGKNPDRHTSVYLLKFWRDREQAERLERRTGLCVFGVLGGEN
jgi:hypothetical protein